LNNKVRRWESFQGNNALAQSRISSTGITAAALSKLQYRESEEHTLKIAPAKRANISHNHHHRGAANNSQYHIVLFQLL